MAAGDIGATWFETPASQAPHHEGREHACDKFNTTGKSLLIIRNRVKPWNQKYFAFHVGQINGTSSAILAHKRGVSRSSRCVGPECDGRFDLPPKKWTGLSCF